MMGNHIIVQAAIDAGAKIMFGYPITPTTEILSQWAKIAEKPDSGLQFLQTEDETSAGFGVCGAVLGGVRAFTASAGPGTILMQDPIAMAEGLRLPFVGVISQRGGPSTGTVIYSQQEVNLVCFGANGESLRLVYAPANLQELYKYTRKAFENAWKYRFPAFVLTDGYLSKLNGSVEISSSQVRHQIEQKPLGNLRNTYSFEEELASDIQKDLADFEKLSRQVAEFEQLSAERSKLLIVAHGSVGAAAKQAVIELRQKGYNVGLFRPITLKPFPYDALSRYLSKIPKMLVIESSAGQLSRLIKDKIYGLTKIIEFQKPALAIPPAEIIDYVKNTQIHK